MKLDVLYEKPPNYDKIVDAIPAAEGEGVIFAYGPYVYYPKPSGTSKGLHPALKEHEAVHLRQQGDDPEAWWDKFLTNIHFRFSQELEAHRAEYRWWRVWRPNKALTAKKQIAAKLRSELYGVGGLIDQAKMERLLETREAIE